MAADVIFPPLIEIHQSFLKIDRMNKDVSEWVIDVMNYSFIELDIARTMF